MNPFLKLLASVVKEFRVIARDRAGLALLFVMPLGFVTVMSLALQDVLGQPEAAARLRFSMVVLDGDAGEVGRAIEEELANLDFVQVRKLPFADFQQSSAGLREQVRTGQERLALIIPADLSARLDRALADGGPGALFDVPAGKRHCAGPAGRSGLACRFPAAGHDCHRAHPAGRRTSACHDAFRRRRFPFGIGPEYRGDAAPRWRDACE